MQHVRLVGARLALGSVIRSTRPISIARFYSADVAGANSSFYRTTTLKNGIQVRTDSSTPNTSALVCGLALSVRAGPRFETDQTDGISYTVERSTEHALTLAAAKTPPALVPLAYKLIPNLEYQTLQLSHLRTPQHLSSALDFLSQTLRARTSLYAYKQSEDVQGEEYMMNDLLHAVAYSGEGLGRRSVPTRQRLREIANQELDTWGLVEAWRREWWVKNGDRMTVVGSGMEHDELVSETERALSWVGGKDLEFEPPQKVEDGLSWIRDTLAWARPKSIPVLSRGAGVEVLSRAHSQYEGGMVVLEGGGGASFLEGGTEIRIAFEGLAEDDEDLPVLEVITIILGGRREWENGGGPGSGLRSRLWLNILMKHPDVSSAKAFNLSYSDTGLVGISAQSLDPSPTAIAALFKMLVDNLHQLTLPMHTYGRKNGKQPVGAGTGRLTMEEINRGKNRTATEWLTERESKTGNAYLDDLLFCRPPPAEIAAKIAAITPQDIQRVARRILGSAKMPTIVGMGPGAKEGLQDAMKVLGKATSQWSQ